MTGRKNVLPPYQFFNAADLSQATLTSPTTDITGIDNIKIVMVTTGNAVGTFAVQTMADATSTWVSLVLNPVPVANGSADTIGIEFRDMADMKIRITYTKTSGTGTVTGWIKGKGK